MATYEKRGNKWRVKVRRKGISKSESFRTKAEGRNWAAQIESEIDTGKHTKESKHTLAEALVRFRDEVSPTREGSRWESVRLNKLISELPKINILLSDVDPEYIAAWRDERLKKVLPSSVNRELNVLSAVFTQAVREWRWCQENPVRLVKRPKNPKARDRLISPEERKSLLEALGYIDGEEPSRSGHYVPQPVDGSTTPVKIAVSISHAPASALTNVVPVLQEDREGTDNVTVGADA